MEQSNPTPTPTPDRLVVDAVNRRLETDSVRDHWRVIVRFLGQYHSRIDPDTMIINYRTGELGKGEMVNGSTNVIYIDIPELHSAVAHIQTLLESEGIQTNETLVKNIVHALIAQTVLHEGTHVLFHTRPESPFAQAVESFGIENKYGMISTLLDEGITYAIQNYYAPSIDGYGKLVLRDCTVDQVREESDPKEKEVLRRKVLGQLLSPLVARYMDEGKAMDLTFIQEATSILKKSGLLDASL